MVAIGSDFYGLTERGGRNGRRLGVCVLSGRLVIVCLVVVCLLVVCLLVECVEDVTVECGDRWFAVGGVGGYVVGGQGAFVWGIMVLGVVCELVFPKGAAGGVGHFCSDLLCNLAETGCVRPLLLVVGHSIRVFDDIGVCSPVAGTEDDFVVGCCAATQSRYRVG